jgi:hypothetical protein
VSALWIHEAAERFWADAGGAPTAYPREIHEAAVWALPVATERIAGLSVAVVDAWLARRDSVLRLTIADRPLRACMVVHEDTGLLFVDATDPPDEQRFSLAHEVAHYLVEYDIPRRHARARLGDGIGPVLDGRRAPSRRERIGSILARVSLGVRYHLMERTPDGHPPRHAVSEAEQCADDLAFELLAPFDAVKASLTDSADRAAAEAALRETFGLPLAPARAYAGVLVPDAPDGSLFQRLFSAS